MTEPPDRPAESDATAALAAQAAFNAGWDLRTRWHRGERPHPSDYRQLLGDEVFGLPEVVYALDDAFWHARREAGE
ncbi:MAG: hypothetical protein K2V38_07540, partial [Gemmataceae bacterium]|nr:hypothetical protein [Gemmataceae bacterium]